MVQASRRQAGVDDRRPRRCTMRPSRWSREFRRTRCAARPDRAAAGGERRQADGAAAAGDDRPEEGQGSVPLELSATDLNPIVLTSIRTTSLIRKQSYRADAPGRPIVEESFRTTGRSTASRSPFRASRKAGPLVRRAARHRGQDQRADRARVVQPPSFLSLAPAAVVRRGVRRSRMPARSRASCAPSSRRSPSPASAAPQLRRRRRPPAGRLPRAIASPASPNGSLSCRDPLAARRQLVDAARARAA